MHYKNHLFRLNEMIDQKTMEDLGKQWFHAHDTRSEESRFNKKADELIFKMNNERMPLTRKAIRKRKEMEAKLLSAPKGIYRPGGPKTQEYYQKAINHLNGNDNPYAAGENYTTRVSRYIGHKHGIEEFPGVDRSKQEKELRQMRVPLGVQKGWARHDDVHSIYDTMGQRAGEHRMAAINRLTDYMNRNGINQENPTAQDRQNYQNWLNRTGGRFLKY